MCNGEVQAGSKVLVVLRGDDEQTLTLRWSCQHFPIDEKDGRILAILASQHCRNLWFGKYFQAVHDCSKHGAA